MKFKFSILFFCGLMIPLFAQEKIQLKPTSFDEAPKWTEDAIWYQIFVERFRNGDPNNDPKPENLEGSYPGFVPEGWHISPWGQDWYQDDDYIANITNQTDFYGNPIQHYGQKLQLRRYGGDLQGVWDHLDYLQELGINAIYFNPINDAPSLHKYDARNWHHIDVNFGPDPEGDNLIIAQENPNDPKTWQWTSADKLFLELVKELHRREIKVILDYSFNHTGIDFWAWKDVLKNQEKSDFKDWYWVEKFDDPATPENEFKYKGWLGVYDLPEIRETAHQDINAGIKNFEGNVFSDEVKNHIFAVTKRWLDPNNDGDFSDGVDGYRMDVAAEMPLGFWRDFRKVVREINPDAYIIGEVWWEAYPDKLTNPEPFLQGDVFDAVMNYRWYRIARHFFNASPDSMKPSEFLMQMSLISRNIRNTNNLAMMNLISGHDSPRALTDLYNSSYGYKLNTSPSKDPNYKVNKPDKKTENTFKMLLAHQFTYIGAPQIWNGDEMGMWGGDDPDNRKPLIWKDIEFETEKAHPLGLNKVQDSVKFNQEIFEYYKTLIHLRKENPVLVNGEIANLLVDDAKEILVYSRFNKKNEILVIFNNSDQNQSIEFKTKKKFKSFKELFSHKEYSVQKNKISLEIPARSTLILLPNTK